MHAIVFDHPGSSAHREVPDPVPRAGQVVVAVGACGICGTDVHIADGEFPPTPYPIIPGHEFAGEVVALGAGVPDDIRVGGRVAVDPSLYCGRCDQCRRGRGNLCTRWAAIGDTVDGAFADYVAVPAANVHLIPDHVDFRQGALVEPLSCAVHAMNRVGPVLGESVLLAGSGTMGLLLGQLLRRAGAASIAVVDRSAARLEVASKLFADRTAVSVDELSDEQFDLSVDATGVAAVIEATLARVRAGGRLLVFGVAPSEATIAVSPFRVYNDEISVIGSMAVLHSFADAVSLIGSRAIETDALLSPPLPIAEFPEALRRVRAGEGVKVQVAPVA
jgi:2-desacetyl-2-hydroxyethyl bacteriochlorophyllide A dehydrogenase